MPPAARRWLILGVIIVALTGLKMFAFDPLWKHRLAPGFWRDVLDGLFLLPMAAFALWASRRIEAGSGSSGQDKP